MKGKLRALIGSELLSVYDVDIPGSAILVKRALMDTVAKPYPAGTALFFYSFYDSLWSPLIFVTKEDIDAKLKKIPIHAIGTMESPNERYYWY